VATTPDAPDSLSPTDAEPPRDAPAAPERSSLELVPDRTEPSPALRPAKQVIVMRKDLHMRKGKMIAQGAHASLKVVLDAGRLDPGTAAFTIALDPAMAAWLGGRFTKVCVSVDSEAALDAIVARARAAGVPCALIVDSGATEFHGVPTKTCCAVGPAWVDAVDAITGGLPLL
jgi:PTH2 family peptidyl-tRNA hydrolase